MISSTTRRMGNWWYHALERGSPSVPCRQGTVRRQAIPIHVHPVDLITRRLFRRNPVRVSSINYNNEAQMKGS
ncbi:MAG: hypothetical protein V7635_713 [Arthrobacter sp.]